MLFTKTEEEGRERGGGGGVRVHLRSRCHVTTNADQTASKNYIFFPKLLIIYIKKTIVSLIVNSN